MAGEVVARRNRYIRLRGLLRHAAVWAAAVALIAMTMGLTNAGRADAQQSPPPIIDVHLRALGAHPQVYVDTGIIVYALPKPEFHRYRQRIAESGFGTRVMFGSDQMVWAGAIEYAISVIEQAPFLSAKQTRDILYNNAARFLRLNGAK